MRALLHPHQLSRDRNLEIIIQLIIISRSGKRAPKLHVWEDLITLLAQPCKNNAGLNK